MRSRYDEKRGNLYVLEYATDGSLQSESYFTPVSYFDYLSVVSGGTGGTPGRKSPHPIEYYRGFGSYSEGTETVFSDTTGRLVRSSEGTFNSSTYPGDWPAYDDTVTAESLSRLYDKVRNTVDLSVSIAEQGQVRRMLRDTARTLEYVRRHPLSGLMQAYRNFRRYPPGSAKAVGSKWLEFQYGWRPLAQDIYNSVIELEKSFRSLMVVEAKASSIASKTARANPSDLEYSELTMSCRNLYKCRYTPATDTTALISNFTSLNPVSIAWELTPYSFVVDWFYDVGGYLRNFESALLQRANFIDGFQTQTYRLTGKGFKKGSVNDAGFTTTYNQTNSISYSWKRRTVLGTTPFPELPRFKADLGSSRLLSAAALLSQHLGR